MSSAPTMQTASTRELRAAARAGATDIVPMVIGVVPFGLAIGATLATSSLSTAQGLVSAVGILAGGAQLTTITMLDDGAAPLVIVVSALIINSRLALYGAGIARFFPGEPLRRRLPLASFVVDQTYFTIGPRFERGDLRAPERRAYYLAGGVFLASSFVAAQLLAMTIGGQLPEWSGIDVAAPLALTGLAAKAIDDGSSALAAVASAVLAVTAVGLPFQISILVAIAGGVAAGIVRDRRTGAVS